MNKKPEIIVALGERTYPIKFVSLISQGNCQIELTQHFERYSQKVWITNNTIYSVYKEFFNRINVSEKNQNLILIADGEEFKNWQVLENILAKLLTFKLDRKSCLIAFGGGVVGDISGLASALYQRGVAIVQIPTTLLAMVDSSVGGKTAVNHPLGKNMIGVFKQPQAVFIDIQTLKTLPEREFAAGLAEVIKYGLLGDKDFFNWLCENINSINAKEEEALQTMIYKCCLMKANIVERDENEQGERALLNLGHTFGHAIEAITQYKTFLHGEAVAIGMAIAANVSQALGYITPDEEQLIIKLLKKANLQTSWKHGILQADFTQKMFEAMAIDKKNSGGKLRLIILNNIGEAKINSDISKEVITEAINKYCHS